MARGREMLKVIWWILSRYILAIIINTILILLLAWLIFSHASWWM